MYKNYKRRGINMILLEDLIKLGENYQLECKKAKGGIPKSI